MTPDQIIALAASVAACMSAIATFLTVRQIAMQREASYRPKLAFSRVYFEAGTRQILAGPLPQQWVVRDPGPSAPEFLEDLALPLRNVGLGAARAVSLVWSFDIEQVVERVNHAAQRTLTPAYFSIDETGVSIKSEVIGDSHSMWRNQREALIDFVLPASVQNEPVSVRLPHAYIQLCAALVFLESKDKDIKRAFELPSLCATLAFKDIGGSGHSAVFDIEVQLTSRNGNGEGMTGYVESSKRV
jgi:hypothetical protein